MLIWAMEPSSTASVEGGISSASPPEPMIGPMDMWRA
jgi:hypothetical protein